MDGSGKSLVDAEYSPESRQAFLFFRNTGEYQFFQVHSQLLGTCQIKQLFLCELSGETLSLIE
jgi:hypothetical protein